MEGRTLAQRKKTVKVVVLGDIGRSPRMQYHALSLAEAGFNVNIVGYTESKFLPELQANSDITVTPLQPFIVETGPKIVLYFLKAFWQFFSLFLTLLITGHSDYLLCQNPPAIPTLPACWLYCLITRSKFYIDWHNYAFTIMALNLRSGHPLLKFAKLVEKYFGLKSFHNFCVTEAMKEDLDSNWNIKATVLYDRPPHIFRPITLQQKHDWFLKLSCQHAVFADWEQAEPTNKSGIAEETAFTRLVDGIVRERSDRPGLLFSSTSWTPDEDFGVLFNALEAYETEYTANKNLPNLICVITGKGPMKEHYINEISNKKWQHIKVITPWLEAADYPTMVASADLGVCLHTSSSGLDLPMKVVDMFGAGLPVCAFKFKCLDELVKDGENGYTFGNPDELAEQIINWFQGFPSNTVQNEIHRRMRKHLEEFRLLRWEKNWNDKAKPFFL